MLTTWELTWINALINRGLTQDQALAAFQAVYGTSSIDLASDPIEAAAALPQSLIASFQ
jgi:hypothetical protein